jgi:hypothetical protein
VVAVVPDQAVGSDRAAERDQRAAAGAGDILPDPGGRPPAGVVLLREALIGVVVAGTVRSTPRASIVHHGVRIATATLQAVERLEGDSTAMASLTWRSASRSRMWRRRGTPAR